MPLAEIGKAIMAHAKKMEEEERKRKKKTSREVMKETSGKNPASVYQEKARQRRTRDIIERETGFKGKKY